ncbi:alanine acetyltransferase, partial [Streptomyces sp. NPDC059233]
YGLAPGYLNINGVWRDHRLFQRLLHDEPLGA